MLSKSHDFSFLNPTGLFLLTGSRTGSSLTSLALLLFDLALPFISTAGSQGHPCCVNQLSPRRSYWLFASALAYRGCSGGSHLSATSLGCWGVEWHICPSSGTASHLPALSKFPFARWSFTHNFKGQKEREKNPLTTSKQTKKPPGTKYNHWRGQNCLSSKSNEEILLSLKVFITSAKPPCGCRFMVPRMAKAETKPDLNALGNVLLCTPLFGAGLVVVAAGVL